MTKTRGRLVGHHPWLGVAVMVAGVGLAVMLVTVINHATATSHYHPPAQTLAADAARTTTGVASDFVQLKPTDLGDALLAQ